MNTFFHFLPITTMDSLLAEINSKRKALTDAPEAGPSKYMRRADVERAQEEEAQRKRDERILRNVRPPTSCTNTQTEPAKNASLTRLASSPRASATPEPTDTPPSETFNISSDEAIRRLRQKGQPIRLFGRDRQGSTTTTACA